MMSVEHERREESKLSKVAKDRLHHVKVSTSCTLVNTEFCLSSKTTIEALHGLMNQVIKDRLFNQIGAKDMTT